MRVCIVGASGKLGQYMVQHALDRGYEVVGVCREQSVALKCLYLVTRSLDPTGSGRARWAMRWKPALNAFAITFEGRIVLSTTN